MGLIQLVFVYICNKYKLCICSHYNVTSMENCKDIDNAHAQTSDTQKTITPDCALELLKKGNERFAANARLNRNLKDQVVATKGGQHPFAIVLGCIDSRAAAELVFDQGIGDVFNTRIAGNFINNDILGGMEFAVGEGVKVILVLGHTGCGAIKAAVKAYESKEENAAKEEPKCTHVGPMVEKLFPAVKGTERLLGETDEDYKNRVVKTNVILAVKNIRKESQCLKEAEVTGTIKIVGGIYDIGTGVVAFLPPIPLA